MAKVKKPYPGKGWKAPPPTINTPLTSKQRVFVHHLTTTDCTPTAAAAFAGYKRPQFFQWELMQKPNIQAAVADGRKAFAKANEMTRQRVMDGYLFAIEQAKTLADPTAQIQGWNSVAKMCGYFEPTRHKLEVSVSGKVLVEKLQTMSDEELLALAEQEEAIEAEFEVVVPKNLLPNSNS